MNQIRQMAQDDANHRRSVIAARNIAAKEFYQEGWESGFRSARWFCLNAICNSWDARSFWRRVFRRSEFRQICAEVRRIGEADPMTVPPDEL